MTFPHSLSGTRFGIHSGAPWLGYFRNDSSLLAQLYWYNGQA